MLGTTSRSPRPDGDAPTLSLTQWIVLAVLVEQPTHGFAIASLTGATGALGQVWTIPRPLVYRALDDLLRVHLAQSVRTEPGQNTLSRTILSASPRGRREVRAWLDEPVAHVRDLRSELLVKMALHLRCGTRPRKLLEAQAERIGSVIQALEARRDRAEPFQRTLLHWRLEQALSAQRFVEGELAQAESQAEGQAH